MRTCTRDDKQIHASATVVGPERRCNNAAPAFTPATPASTRNRCRLSGYRNVDADADFSNTLHDESVTRLDDLWIKRAPSPESIM